MNSAKLFNDSPRTEMGPASYSEARFTYLDRCARDSCAKIRDLLEEWFGRYPEKERADFTSRFRSKNDVHFISSFFELYLHELLLRLGYVVTAHPEMSPDQSKRPDFRGTSPSGDSLIVEAVLAHDNFDEDFGAMARKNTTIDSINQIVNNEFTLSIREKGFPQTTPSGLRLRVSIEAWLATLDADACLKLVVEQRAEELPQMSWEHDGWSVTFVAWPIHRRDRGRRDRRLVGSQSTEFRAVDSRAPLRKAIKRKATRYGQIGGPYVVAVNVRSSFLDDIDIAEALFGEEQHSVFETEEGEFETLMSRRPDGAWRGPGGSRNTRVSAVLIVRSLDPWGVTARTPEIFHNPWAAFPCIGPITELTQHIPKNGKLIKRRGRPPHEVFQLPISWPFQE